MYAILTPMVHMTGLYTDYSTDWLFTAPLCFTCYFCLIAVYISIICTHCSCTCTFPFILTHSL